MDDSLFARLGNDPTRFLTAIYGRPPAPGGIVRLTAPNAGEQAGAAGAPADAAPEPARPEPVEPSADDPRGAEVEPEPAARTADEADSEAVVRSWLARNRHTIEALQAAGCLSDLAPPEAAPAGEPQAPPPEAPKAPAKQPPLPVRKGDRWTKWKMAEFLRQLAATHSVSAAANAVGMHRRSAYKLRARLKGQPFDIAWEAAFRHGYDNLAHSALELALEGEEVPHYYQGKLKGTHRKHNSQLIVQLLKMRNRAGAPMLGRYGAAAEWWGDRWDVLLERVETGSVDWSDEHAALGEGGLAQLELPDAKREVDQLAVRNSPDEGPKGR